MSRSKACSVCNHPKGTEVVGEIAIGRITTAEAARKLGVPRAAVKKHLRECLKVNIRE